MAVFGPIAHSLMAGIKIDIPKPGQAVSCDIGGYTYALSL